MSEDDFPSNQKRALAALLTSKTMGQAAKACGLSQKTIQRYLALAPFRAALKQAETESMEGIGRRLLTGQHAALTALEAIIEGGTESNCRMAAVAWVELTLKLRELNQLEARVTALEEALK